MRPSCNRPTPSWTDGGYKGTDWSRGMTAMSPRTDVGPLSGDGRIRRWRASNPTVANVPEPVKIRPAILVQAARKWAWDYPHCV